MRLGLAFALGRPLLLLSCVNGICLGQYSSVDLGSLGGFETYATAINSAGHVVGRVMDNKGNYTAFIYSSSLTSLGTLGGSYAQANAISGSDIVVGRSLTTSGDTHAFLVNAAGANPTMADLHGTVGLGGSFSSGIGINGTGKVVGVASTASGVLHAFLYDLNTGVSVDLHPRVSFGGTQSVAYGINDLGVVVGFSQDASGNSIPFSYDSNSNTLVQLGTDSDTNSTAMSVNASGAVVGISGGFAFTSSGNSRITSLGSFGGSSSASFWINSSGTIVGSADDASSETHAFVYDTVNGMRDLETLVSSNSGLLFFQGAAINDAGQIAVNGYDQVYNRAFLLTPNFTALSSGQIATTASGLAYSRVSQTFNGTVTLTNISSNTIAGPFSIVFTGLPTGVTLANSTGMFSGSPYIAVPNMSTLASGQSSTVNVQFRNPSNATIKITPAIYSGSLN